MSEFQNRLSQEQERLTELRRQQAAIDAVRTIRNANIEAESKRLDGTDPSLVVGEADAALLSDYLNHMKSLGMPRANLIPYNDFSNRPTAENKPTRGLFRSKPATVNSPIVNIKGYVIGRTNLRYADATQQNWPHLGSSYVLSGGREYYELKDRFPGETGCESLYSEYRSRKVLICEDNRLRTEEGKNIYSQDGDGGRELVLFASGGDTSETDTDLDSPGTSNYFVHVPLARLLPIIALRDSNERQR